MRIFCGCLNSCWKCISCGYRQPSKVLLEKINLEIAHRGITISDLEAKMERKPIADIGAVIMSKKKLTNKVFGYTIWDAKSQIR